MATTFNSVRLSPGILMNSLQDALEGVLMLNSRGSIVFFNKAAERLSAYPSAEAMDVKGAVLQAVLLRGCGSGPKTYRSWCSTLSTAATGWEQGVSHIGPRTWSLLMAYDWPGNIRELQHAIESAYSIGTGGILLAEDLPSVVRGEELALLGVDAATPATRLDEIPE